MGHEARLVRWVEGLTEVVADKPESRETSALSLYADICRGAYASDEDIEFDVAAQTWTVLAAWGADAIPGLPNKEIALAIARALYTAWIQGGNNANCS